MDPFYDKYYTKKYYTKDCDRLLVTWQDLMRPNCLSDIKMLFGMFNTKTVHFFDIVKETGFNDFECYVPGMVFGDLLKIVQKEKFYRLRDKSLDELIFWTETPIPYTKRIKRTLEIYNSIGSIIFKEQIDLSDLEPKEEELVEIDFDNTFYNNHFPLERIILEKVKQTGEPPAKYLTSLYE